YQGPLTGKPAPLTKRAAAPASGEEYQATKVPGRRPTASCRHFASAARSVTMSLYPVPVTKATSRGAASTSAPASIETSGVASTAASAVTTTDASAPASDALVNTLASQATNESESASAKSPPYFATALHE